MPRTSKQEATQVATFGPYEGRSTELDEFTVVFERHADETDYGPLLKGLPEDKCQSPHWGVVVNGELTYRYQDHDEVYRAGDAYYARPGHHPMVTAGTEVIEFSPTRELQETLAVVSENIEDSE